ncbi:MAG: formate dehydrogenase accessory sulfurtransferase FdhD [Coriobacteriia bacterium]|nr:formate dehydrogenase accessory sulfurtransferase FdhD [Coriobacteriia bacterium]
MTPNDAIRIPVTAAVMAGGRSMRMGVDKTLLPVDGETLLARVVDAVSSVCAHTVIVTNRPEQAGEAGLAVGVPVLVDEVPYQGPLGGLVTALKDAPDDWVLAVAADMPWLEPDLILALWDARGDAQVVIPLTDKGPEPLLALYHRDCLPAARRVLESGRRRLVAMFPELRVVEVPVESLRLADPGLRSLVNVNTPDDLAEVRESGPGEDASAVKAVVVRAVDRHDGRMPIERAITVHMNDVEVATMQATPDDLEELAAGFLVSEGLLVDRDALKSIDADHKRGLIYVETAEEVPDELTYRRRYITSGCGKGVTFASVGHARDLAPVESDFAVAADVLHEWMQVMNRLAQKYRDTGGMQACALAREGEVAYVREDVGRHNAVDKLLGRAWLDRVSTTDAVLLSTGRISYEMAVKAAKARVPLVVSKSAVTDLAAEIAAGLGIAVVGYARGGGMVVYTHPERVVVDRES